MYNFKIPGKAMGAVRMTHRGKFVNKAAQRYLVYKSHINKTASEYKDRSGFSTLEGPLKVCLDFYFTPPKTYTKKKLSMIQSGELMYVKKPDADNLAKSILDGMNKVIYNDDNQIVELQVRKHYSDEDHVEVKIEEL